MVSSVARPRNGRERAAVDSVHFHAQCEIRRNGIQPMIVQRTSSGVVEIQTFAKVNLFLEILAKRPDGFHELETVMARIDLADTLSFSPLSEPRIELSWREDFTLEDAAEDPAAGLFMEAPPPVPPVDENLVYRAVDRLRREYGVKQGVSIALTKRVPLASGLAGGSSDAAAALWGAALLWELPRDVAKLQQIAASLGSDIPFFLLESPPGSGAFASAALACGRGERLAEVSGLAGLNLVVARPPAGLSTALVYRHCRPSAAPKSSAALIAALQRRDLDAAGKLLHNQLQPPAEELSPWVRRLKAAFDELDLPGHQMSGSGTAYFGLCRDAEHAARCAAALRAMRLGRVWALQTV